MSHACQQHPSCIDAALIPIAPQGAASVSSRAARPTDCSCSRIRTRSRHLTWMALVSAWPRCSEPVTLGGGMTITNGSPFASARGLKNPCASHQSYLHMHQGVIKW